MITEQKILGIVAPLLEEKEMFVAELELKPTNKIFLYVDSLKGVKISDCVDVSRLIESTLDRETEDFELSVSSAGLDLPLRHIKQYEKNKGQQVEVIATNGLKFKGELTGYTEEHFVITFEEKIKVEGKKKKQTVTKSETFTYGAVKSVKVIPVFR